MEFHTTMLCVYFALALGVSFLCSLMEASLLSMPRAHALKLRKEGRRSGRMLESMKASIDRPLAAILTLNTVANTAGATGVGAEAYIVFEGKWIAATTAVLTISILVCSEIIPKTLGAVHARKLAPFTAWIVQAMMLLTYPLVWLLERIGRAFGATRRPRLTREDLSLITEMGRDEGALHRRESRIIQNLLRMQDHLVKNVMTPRKVVLMLQKDLSCAEAMRQCEASGFSRMPLYGKDRDEVVGVVLRRDLSDAVRKNKGDAPVESIKRDIAVVPEQATIDAVLWNFFSTGHHMFLVVDEYGGTAGIITLEDALETMIGMQIVDETDRVVNMRRQARRAQSLPPDGLDVDASTAPRPHDEPQ